MPAICEVLLLAFFEVIWEKKEMKAVIVYWPTQNKIEKNFVSTTNIFRHGQHFSMNKIFQLCSDKLLLT